MDATGWRVPQQRTECPCLVRTERDCSEHIHIYHCFKTMARTLVWQTKRTASKRKRPSRRWNDLESFAHKGKADSDQELHVAVQNKRLYRNAGCIVWLSAKPQGGECRELFERFQRLSAYGQLQSIPRNWKCYDRRLLGACQKKILWSAGGSAGSTT